MRAFMVKYFLIAAAASCFTTSNAIAPSLGLVRRQDVAFAEPIEILECIDFKSLDGLYTPLPATSESNTACGLYIVGDLTTRIKVEFVDFSVDCDGGHVVGVLDGWEQGGSTFPPVEDLTAEGTRNRHSTFCGRTRPRRTFYSSGNFALIQYKLAPSDGFTVRVTFEDNLTPCNGVALGDEGQFELRNFGRRSNCSVMIIHPQQLQISYMNVGKQRIRLTGLRALRPQRSQIFAKAPDSTSTDDDCTHLIKLKDYTEVLGGLTWSVGQMHSYGHVCGIQEMSSPQNNFCETTVVRLVSSGHYNNVVAVEHGKVSAEDPQYRKSVCPARAA
ncbi:putative Corticotropin-releasing factor-binding protein [Hypsibius exemplaris]|uniref:Corticotropin-releasing factor-binding protein n=1 Tax=Hypsibius exemplaris TaxID=2072580 RepID=A0A1W0XEC3_HYPEX|nr:putative Corticotropin-releasing factor-binding protein [Hypsibius exemplaris]